MLESFIDSGYRFITIYAPGGYGKSILLADFTQTTNLPVCWCSLEPSDRDPTSFLTILAHSITDRFHEIEPAELFRLIERGETQNSVRRIATLLGKVGPHIIIIDDYHKAVSAGITLALDQLLDQLPDASTIIVAARGDLELETGQILDLLMTERASGLSEEELRFTPDEIQLMMRKRFGRRIDLETAADIAQATDGNIAQVLLAGHMMKIDETVGGLWQRLGDDRQVIYQYLATEVFAKQSPELQRFMLHTAVLPNMTVELCNALLDISDAQTHIEALVYNDLFIAQIGGGFRYHDLFAEFLRTQLATDKALYSQVSKKAANLLTVRSRTQDAIPLYLSVHAWDKTAKLLESQGREFYDTGRALTLNGWLNQMPERELIKHPGLLLLQGQILGYDLGQLEQALDLLKKAKEQFQQKKNLIGTAEAQIFQAKVSRMMGRAEEALSLATEGLNQLETLRADKHLIALAIRSRGSIHLFAGNTVAALSDLRRALELFEQLDDTYTVGACHHEIGVCLEAHGNISGADHHYRQALRSWETLGNANDLSNTLNSLGVSLYTVGHYDEALQQFNNSLNIALQIGAIRRAAFAQAGIGDVYLECQDYEKAIEAYTRSTEYAREASVHSLEIYNLIKVGECFYRQHDLPQALRRANRARAIAIESGLGFEKGLAAILQAKINVQREDYKASFSLFAETVASFAEKNVLEQAKARLWWGYSLLLDLRPSAARKQLQEAIRLALAMGDLVHGLGTTIAETQHLLFHFLHRADTSASLRNNIWLLLTQNQKNIDLLGPGLQVFAFGSPSVTVAGERKQFNQRGGISKAPELLLYLLLEGQDVGCSWSEVSVAIWPDLSRNKASIKYHQILKSLRYNTLDQDSVIVQGDHYQINPNYLEWCDALAFEQLFERLTQTTAADALALQLELISLYQGEFLAGFDLGEWGEDRRLSYEARFLQVVKLAGKQLVKNNAPQEALSIINQGLNRDYFREDLHRTALRAYAQAGLYDDLTTYYTKLCQTFEQELNTSPSATTKQLYLQLMGTR
ncbi:MAG: tetratricopeptide repeat protein [Chloroflexi bacterium]|nr:tetratricopeptide repeat protein [Chloroflexota bacterium]